MIRRAAPSHRALLPATAALTAAGLLLSGCSSLGAGATGEPTSGGATGAVVEGTTEELQRYYTQTVAWEDCEFEVETNGAQDDLQCADVEVPLDYADPAGGTTTVVMSRLPARGDARGSLLLNPGGPGASGVDAMLYAQYTVTGDVREAYDVVGFDPRGVSRSEGIECLEDAELDAWRAEPMFDPQEQPAAQIREEYERLGAACVQDSGELVAEMDTVSAARDMDVLRAVLGDERMTYLGFSYGTLLGAVYAELFPDRVGRLVLDGGVDPTLSDMEATADQAEGFEDNLRHWVQQCQFENPDCVLADVSVDEAMTRIQELIASVEEGTVTAADGRRVTATNVVEGILGPLYATTTYEALNESLGDAFDGDFSALLAQSDLTHGRNAEGRYTSNTTVAFTAVNCLDRPEGTVTEEQMAQHQEELERVSPTFGPYLGYGDAACQGWPAEPAGLEEPLDAEGADPVLVVGTTHDPATPYHWSEALVEQLDDARLLTYDSYGHTAYTAGSRCVQEAVDAYLLEGELPAPGTTCS
ncbi:alpha/beta hydrolase [uncultured Kocuria sp.]|uniref:alpha/beta hydrolase n=1 Tax=uncultured Kocuria sp. TaxID=259305 RepID=UPI00260F71DE|nr:alpha/beta hydrolase [uncultured Kocuria sp.]